MKSREKKSFIEGAVAKSTNRNKEIEIFLTLCLTLQLPAYLTANQEQ